MEGSGGFPAFAGMQSPGEGMAGVMGIPGVGGVNPTAPAGMAALLAGGSLPGMPAGVIPGAPTADDLDAEAKAYYNTRMERHVRITGHYCKNYNLLDADSAAQFGKLYVELRARMAKKEVQLLNSERIVVNHPGYPVQMIAFIEWQEFCLVKADHGAEGDGQLKLVPTQATGAPPTPPRSMVVAAEREQIVPSADQPVPTVHEDTTEDNEELPADTGEPHA